MTKNPLLSNYWKEVVPSLFTIEILEPLPLKGIKYIMAFIILEIGHILMLQKLEMLIMVLRLLEVSVLRFAKLNQHIQKSQIPLANLKLLLKNGNQNLVHVSYVESIYKIKTTYRLEHKFCCSVCTYSIKLQIMVSFKSVRERFFGTGVNGFQLRSCCCKNTQLKKFKTF